jgi:hypothetical protein
MLSVIVSGTTYSLTDNTYTIWMGDDGAGMLPMHNISTRGNLQNGSTYEDYRADPRTVRLAVEILGTSLNDLYTKRGQLLRIFKPGQQIKLLYTLPDASLRQLDCRFAGDMVMPTADADGFAQKVGIALTAFDPSFYDPLGVGITFNLGGGAGAGVIPMVVPTLVGTSTLDTTNVVAYSGTYDSYPTLIRVTGPITNCIITNAATGDKLDFTGTTIAAADYYDIDCRYGYKTVKDKAGTNKVGTLTTDSDLATWRFLAAVDGSASFDNSISVTGSSVTGATNVDISFFTRFVGL